MPNNTYIYCDSCVFIAYFNNEPGRVEILEQFFEEIQQSKDRMIVTSAFSIAEVAYVQNEHRNPGQKSRLRQDTEERLDQFWGDQSLIEFVDFQELLARNARTLMRRSSTRGYNLRAPDALHLVSAQFVGAAEFLTYDDLGKHAELTGLKILEPHIEQPKLL